MVKKVMWMSDCRVRAATSTDPTPAFYTRRSGTGISTEADRYHTDDDCSVLTTRGDAVKIGRIDIALRGLTPCPACVEGVADE